MTRNYIAAIFLFLLVFSCQVDSKIIGSNSIDGAGSAIDSLWLSPKMKVIILESESGERIVSVRNDQKTIGENNELIGCKTCGYQGGDPYVSMRKEENGFRIFIEYESYYFFIETDTVYLKEIDLLRLEHTNDGVLENHIVKNRTDFGVIRLGDLKREVVEKIMVAESISFKKVVEATKTTQLPLEYSYSFILDLKDFVRVNYTPDYKEFTYLSDLKFSKLPSFGKTELLLVSGYMESGQSEMFLVTLNEDYEAVGYLKLYSHKEIEDGGILTRFEIDENCTIEVSKDKIVNRVVTNLEKNTFRINDDGTIRKVIPN